MNDERQRLVNAAYRLLASRADAEDAVQDTYVRALTIYADSLEPQPAWLHTVLRHIAIDRLRRKRFESESAADALATDQSVPTPLEIRSECEAALRHLLHRVSSAEAAAMVLREVFEFDYEDIACLLGKSAAASRQFLHRARTRARRATPSVDVEECLVALCWRAIAARDPAPLMRLLQTTLASGRSSTLSVAQGRSARSASMLVQVNGTYALALVLDGVVLCVVPVGTPTPAELQCT
jgi:RNA polymerase sigma-70 factor (ECF subfamily)